MPLVPSFYKPPFLFKNGFISTVHSGLVRKVQGVHQERERLWLTDGDFLDIDWSFSKQKTSSLIILLHGLEGDAQRPYMIGTAKLFNNHGIDAACINFRGCSGEQNLKYRSYHSGATEDLHDVIIHAIKTRNYKEIYLKGFSLGGNMLLKYLGERVDVPNQIKVAIAVSVPCDLNGSCIELHKFKNVLYHDRFKRHLINRLKHKQTKFPDRIKRHEIQSIKTLKDFDDIYTSKAHGFKNALDYYQQCSSLQFLHNIKIPSLILNAANDSFLSSECYPISEAKENPNLFLEIPNYGGHVGFYQKGDFYYNEERAVKFLFESR